MFCHRVEYLYCFDRLATPLSRFIKVRTLFVTPKASRNACSKMTKPLTEIQNEGEAMSNAVVFAELAKWVVGITLLLAGLGKAVTFHAFKENLKTLFQAPRYLVAPFALGLIIMELTLSFALLFYTPFADQAMGITAFLFFAFTLFIATILFNDKIVQCNCFGKTGERITWSDLIRNTCLLGLCFYSLSAPSAPLNLTGIGWFALVCTSLMFVQILIHLNDIKILLLSPFLQER